MSGAVARGTQPTGTQTFSLIPFAFGFHLSGTLTWYAAFFGGLIGPGGKIIKSIVEATEVKINVEDDGRVFIASPDSKKAMKALDMVKNITADAEIGKVYNGKVIKIMNFGAFVEILPGKEGLVHVSQLDDKFVKDVKSIVKEGEEILVKVIGVDPQGKISLTRKGLSEKKEESN